MNPAIKVFRNGLIYGIGLFILSYIFYGNVYPLKQALLISGSIGFAALVINGLLFRRYTKPTKKLDAINITLQDSEILKAQAPANHTIDEHQIPGKLFLTDKRLVFVSCQQEDQEQQEHSWSLTNQQSFKFYPTIFNAGGEFIIICNDQQLVFEVDELKLWKKALLEK
jgi:hypothetical protein